MHKYRYRYRYTYKIFPQYDNFNILFFLMLMVYLSVYRSMAVFISCDEQVEYTSNILKHHGINTIIYDINFLVAGHFWIHEFNKTGENISNNIKYLPAPGQNKLPEFAQKLFVELRKNTNTVILIHIETTQESSINEWLMQDILNYDADKSEYKPIIVLGIHIKYRKLIVEKIAKLLALNPEEIKNAVIIYNIKFNVPTYDKFYLEVIYQPTVLHLMNIYNVFGYEIIHIENVISHYDYLVHNFVQFEAPDEQGVYVADYQLKYVRKHNLTNNNSEKYKGNEKNEKLTYSDASRICIIVDEKFMLQSAFIECLSPDYIIILTDSKNKREGNKSYRISIH